LHVFDHALTEWCHAKAPLVVGYGYKGEPDPVFLWSLAPIQGPESVVVSAAIEISLVWESRSEDDYREAV
jgi:hypothetical protein